MLALTSNCICEKPGPLEPFSLLDGNHASACRPIAQLHLRLTHLSWYLVSLIRLYLAQRHSCVFPMSASQDDQLLRHSGRGPAALEDDVYDVQLAMLNGTYTIPPRSQRNNAETLAFRKRRNYHIEVVHNPLTGQREKRLIHSSSGKISLNRSEVNSTVRKAYLESKGEGAKKIFHIVGRDFVGLGGQHGIQRKLNAFPEKQQH